MRILYPICLACMLLFAHTLSAQVPKLNSHPSAAAVIFLDFDGHTVKGTSWNSNGPIFAAPSNLSEEKIIEIFNRVAEDYRPFNINVTTDSTKYLSAPTKRRMRAILTITYEWYGKAGGIAFTNSFTWGDNTPCFVFTSLLNYSAKDIAEAASHEVGHTLGLRHQARYNDECVKTEDYNSGIGSGTTSWAPIMGVGYYRNHTTWHNGPNPFGCSNAQDDLAIITSSTNGFGYRPQDHGGTFSTATNMLVSNKKISETGSINTNTEQDFFKIAMPADNRLLLEAIPFNVDAAESGSNLNVELKLYDSNKNLLNSYNPPTTLTASIDTFLNKGEYYIAVTGGSSAFTSSYASLGAYSLKGSFGDMTVLPLHRLQLTGNSNGQQHQLNWKIEADEAIVKQVLEVSENGSAFTAVAQLGSEARTYTHYAASSGNVQYRVSVTFDNGRQHYSNIIALRNKAASKPQLYTNMVNSNSLMVSSPSVYSYTITDLNGRQMAKGQLVQGSSTINTGSLSQGIYIIHFSNGNEQHVEKFTRR